MFHTVICDMLGIRYPILQGAMQGGGGPTLVAALGEAGGLGVLPSFGGTAEDLRDNILAVRAQTGRPFAVNIMPMGPGFTESRVEVCIEMDVGIVTTGRADPGEKIVRRLKEAGVTVISVIPTVEHARRMVAEGVDAVVASGTEAGGHVGRVATLPLVPMVVDAVDVPVLAAGGIGDGRGFLAAFALGASGVQIGTRFMATAESEMNRWGVETLQTMRETDTVVTKAMTGATVRCIATPELLAYEKARESGAPETELNTLMRSARATKPRNNPEDCRQYAAGQVAGLIHDVPTVAELIERIVREAAELAEKLPEIGRR